MDQQTQPQGNFVGFTQRYKQAGDKRPNFDGRIAIPGTEREFRVALWANQDKHGNTMFSGRSADISTSDNALAQINAMAGVGTDARTMEENGISLAPGQIVLFKNGYKDPTNPEDKKPDFYGRWNPGSGEKLVSVSVWARTNTRGEAMLTGQTQYALPGRKEGMETAPEDTLTGLAESSDGRKRGGRSGSRAA